ncbi:hypothetical protein HDV00_011520, partial [Rhizophlyctis rosea]
MTREQEDDRDTHFPGERATTAPTSSARTLKKARRAPAPAVNVNANASLSNLNNLRVQTQSSSSRRPVTRKQGHTLTSTNLSDFRASTSASSLSLAPTARADGAVRRPRSDSAPSASNQLKRKRSGVDLKRNVDSDTEAAGTATSTGRNTKATPEPKKSPSRHRPEERAATPLPTAKPKPYNSDEIREYMLKKRKERRQFLQQNIPSTPTPLSAAPPAQPRPTTSPVKQKRYTTDQIRAYMQSKALREEEDRKKKKEEEEAVKRRRKEALEGLEMERRVKLGLGLTAPGGSSNTVNRRGSEGSDGKSPSRSEAGGEERRTFTGLQQPTPPAGNPRMGDGGRRMRLSVGSSSGTSTPNTGGPKVSSRRGSAAGLDHVDENAGLDAAAAAPKNDRRSSLGLRKSVSLNDLRSTSNSSNTVKRDLDRGEKRSSFGASPSRSGPATPPRTRAPPPASNPSTPPRSRARSASTSQMTSPARSRAGSVLSVASPERKETTSVPIKRSTKVASPPVPIAPQPDDGPVELETDVPNLMDEEMDMVEDSTVDVEGGVMPLQAEQQQRVHDRFPPPPAMQDNETQRRLLALVEAAKALQSRVVGMAGEESYFDETEGTEMVDEGTEMEVDGGLDEIREAWEEGSDGVGVGSLRGWKGKGRDDGVGGGGVGVEVVERGGEGVSSDEEEEGREEEAATKIQRVFRGWINDSDEIGERHVSSNGYSQNDGESSHPTRQYIKQHPSAAHTTSLDSLSSISTTTSHHTPTSAHDIHPDLPSRKVEPTHLPRWTPREDVDVLPVRDPLRESVVGDEWSVVNVFARKARSWTAGEAVGGKSGGGGMVGGGWKGEERDIMMEDAPEGMEGDGDEYSDGFEVEGGEESAGGRRRDEETHTGYVGDVEVGFLDGGVPVPVPVAGSEQRTKVGVDVQTETDHHFDENGSGATPPPSHHPRAPHHSRNHAPRLSPRSLSAKLAAEIEVLEAVQESRVQVAELGGLWGEAVEGEKVRRERERSRVAEEERRVREEEERRREKEREREREREEYVYDSISDFETASRVEDLPPSESNGIMEDIKGEEEEERSGIDEVLEGGVEVAGMDFRLGGGFDVGEDVVGRVAENAVRSVV